MRDNPILDALGQLPTEEQAPAPAAARFAARGRLPARALTVEVEEFGELGADLAPDQVRALHARSAPAQFGRRSETLLDAAVRDTGEISADALSLHWADGQVFAELQAEVARGLGLEALELHLHNLLIYQVGQFFKPHQDTEKHPRMVGTVVLVLPSAHIGGELRVRLGQEEARFASQQLAGGQDIRWFAFYADCRHEVLPVEEGWRVVLSFDLVLPKAAAAVGKVSPALLAATRQFFGLDAQPRMAPWVLLLDHEYTAHGLGWALLKGNDRPRVAALRAVARELGLSAHLALAELHETWTALPGEGGSRRGRYRDAVEDAVPDELIDASMVLDHWLAEGEQVGSPARLAVNTEHVDAFTNTSDVHLVDTEYEGYMGNYGDTLDYWYRRAALVLQSPQAAERSRFITDFDRALAALCALSRRAGASAELHQRVRANADLLLAAARGPGRVLLAACAEIAAALTDAQLAADVMSDFRYASLLPEDAATLVRLEKAHGPDWVKALLARWMGTADRHGHGSLFRVMDTGVDMGVGGAAGLWPTPLSAFIRGCAAAGMGEALLDAMLATHVSLLTRFDAGLLKESPAHRAAVLPAHHAAVCELAASLRDRPGCVGLMAELLSHVGQQPRLYPAPELAELALASGDVRLREQVTAALQAAITAPPRGPGDHGLRGVEWVCACGDCTRVRIWAEAWDGEALLLPLAEARRSHVSTQLQAAGAAIVTQLVKTGSPYRLRFSKPTDLAAQDQALRQRWQKDLACLRVA